MTIEERIEAAKKTKRLDLSQSGLTEFPMEILEISDLENLIIGGYKKRFNFEYGQNADDKWGNYNYIKSIPEAIIKLSHLKYLDLTFNPIGEIPPYLFKLTNLEYLKLNLCGIKEIPKGISKLVNIKELELGSFEDWQAFAFSLGFSYEDFPRTGNGENYRYIQDFHLEEIQQIWKYYDYKNEIQLIPDELLILPKIERIDLSYNNISAFSGNYNKLNAVVMLLGNPILINDQRIQKSVFQKLLSKRENINFLTSTIWTSITNGKNLFYDKSYIDSLKIIYPTVESICNKLLLDNRLDPENRELFEGLRNKLDKLQSIGVIKSEIKYYNLIKNRNKILHGNLDLSERVEILDKLVIESVLFIIDILAAY